jgi:hypothetical protein
VRPRARIDLDLRAWQENDLTAALGCTLARYRHSTTELLELFGFPRGT